MRPRSPFWAPRKLRYVLDGMGNSFNRVSCSPYVSAGTIARRTAQLPPASSPIWSVYSRIFVGSYYDTAAYDVPVRVRQPTGGITGAYRRRTIFQRCANAERL